MYSCLTWSSYFINVFCEGHSWNNRTHAGVINYFWPSHWIHSASTILKLLPLLPLTRTSWQDLPIPPLFWFRDCRHFWSLEISVPRRTIDAPLHCIPTAVPLGGRVPAERYGRPHVCHCILLSALFLACVCALISLLLLGPWGLPTKEERWSGHAVSWLISIRALFRLQCQLGVK